MDYFTTNYGYWCADCPSNSTSPPGSMDLTDCKCDKGYSGPDGGLCTICQAGKYKSSIGSGSCEDCEAGTYQDVAGSQTCNSCASQCGEDQYILGCGGVNSGECIDNWGVTSCGSNNKGQLGINSKETGIALIKVRIQNNMFNNIKITKISAGKEHSLFLTREGHVYSCGYNRYGQLGFDSGNWEDDPDDGREWRYNHAYHIRPVLIEKYYNNNELLVNYNEITITKILASNSHSLFLTSNDQVYSCGFNLYGQLGLGTSGFGEDKSTPTLIRTYYNSNEEPITYTNITITEISGGFAHSLFLTDEGRVYSCGWNDDGQLGLNTNNRKIPTPTLIETYYNSDEEPITYTNIMITKISSYDYHSLFLTSDGYVYSCGKNDSGQLGLDTSGRPSGRHRNESAPKLVLTSNITEISAGGLHSLFLNSDGRVYGCGNYFNGQLGLNINTRGFRNSIESIPRLIEKYYYNDKESITYDEITITKIFAGSYESLFITSNKHVYSCGGNKDGQLSLGNRNKQIKPILFQITSDTEITEISCGEKHILFLESYGD